MKKKVIGKIIDGALNVLIAILTVFLLISLYTAVQVRVLGNEYANFFGYSLFEVQTGSMHGTIEAGDWIVVKGTKDVERNDIITYRHGKDFVTHRVVEIYKGSYITKGDANSTKDGAIDREQVVGKVVHILHGFGIIKKIFFNPIVIVFLIICLYLFNQTFKTKKTALDVLFEKMFGKSKHRTVSSETEDKIEKKPEVVKESEVIPEKVAISEEKPAEVIEEVSTESVSEEPVAEKVEPTEDNHLEENISDTTIENNVVEEEQEEEDPLSKTMFQVIQSEDVLQALAEEETKIIPEEQRDDTSEKENVTLIEEVDTPFSNNGEEIIIPVQETDAPLSNNGEEIIIPVEEAEVENKEEMIIPVEETKAENKEEVEVSLSGDELPLSNSGEEILMPVIDEKEATLSIPIISTTESAPEEVVTPAEDVDVSLNVPENIPSDMNFDDENLSKTSFYRIISVEEDDDEEGEYYEEPVIEKVIEEAPKEEKEKKTRIKKVQLNAEEVTPRVKKKRITRKYIQERIGSKKASNILDKTFMIKKIIYDEVLDVLLEHELSYIQNSPMRKQYIQQYMNCKYFGLDSDRENIKEVMNSFSEELRKKFIRDERKTKTIDAYSKAFATIDHMESKSGAINYRKEILSFKKFDEDTVSQMELKLSNIYQYSMEILNDILGKLKTNAFKERYHKLEGCKGLYGVELDHNISFSKVYSNYIVDKTYSEGIISEDKIVVLLNILMCQVTRNIIDHDYDSKYFVYIPTALYGKSKKLDKIVSTINNDYAKTHICFLTTASNMIENESDFNRLSKKGFHFAVSFNKPIKYNNKNMGYIYLADYYFVDTNLEVSDVCKNVPREIMNKLIRVNLEKKIGDYKGD